MILTQKSTATRDPNASRQHVVNMPNKVPILVLAMVAACDRYDVPCYESPRVECPPATEPCEAAEGDTGEAECTPWEEPIVIGETVQCGGAISDIEVMSDDAAVQYGVTDYAFESGATSFAGLLDFQPMPEPFDGVGDPWGGYLRAAIPGVATHAGNGGQIYAGYFSRVCCPQAVVTGSLDALPENPTCASSGYTLNHVPGAWCLDMEGLSGAGLCVYPCHEDTDCAEPAREFCDLGTPDPNGSAPGVCRYKSMPTIPTAHEDINP